jgi:hypothetical protein
MASNLRRTDDLQRLKTRELVMQRTDGTYAVENSVPRFGTATGDMTTSNVTIDPYDNVVIPGTATILTDLNVVGNTDVSGSLGVVGDAGVGGALDVAGNAGIGGNLDVSGALGVVGGAAIGGNLDVAGNAGIGGNLDVSGALGVVSGAAIGGNLDVAGNAGIGGNLDVSGALGVVSGAAIGGNLDVAGNAGIGGNLDISGALGVVGGLVIEGELDVAGGAVIGGNVDISGTLTVQQSITATTDIIFNNTIPGVLTYSPSLGLLLNGVPLSSGTFVDTRYFTAGPYDISGTTGIRTIPLLWPADYWADSSGQIQGDWTCSIVGVKFITSETVNSLRDIAYYCRTDSSGWSVYIKYADSDIINKGTAIFDIMVEPAGGTDDRRTSPIQTFDAYAAAAATGGLTPFVGSPVNGQYKRVISVPSTSWPPPGLNFVSQIVSVEYTVYSEIDQPSSYISDARFVLHAPSADPVHHQWDSTMYYSYSRRVNRKTGLIPNSSPPTNYRFLPNGLSNGLLYAVGTPETGSPGPALNTNSSATITNQGILRMMFGEYASTPTPSNTIDKVRGIQGCWYIGYPATSIGNSECTQFKINYNL